MADETDYGFGGYDLGGYDDSLGYDWEEWFDPSQWGVDTPYGSINENVDPSKTVVNKDGTTYFYDKNNNFLGGVGSSGQVITNTPGNQFASVLRNLFSGTGDLGKLGQLGAFAGLAGLANQSNFFNPPTQKVGFQGVIPKYEYDRQQTPMSVQRPEGYRPGQGGVTYFTPGQYYDVGYDPATAGEFLNTDTTLPSAPETTESQLARGGLAYADGGFTNEQIYNTYQGLLGQGMTHDQILAAAARNPNLNLNAGQINTALAQFQAPKFTDQQFLDAGRTALQQGLDPQTALQKAAEFGASQDQLNRLTGALSSSGIAGLVTPTTTLAYNPPANIPAPPSDYTNAYTQYENQQNTNRVREVIDSGMSTFANKANITTQDILETGRSLLQQGVNPQDVLNQLAKNPSVTQATLNSAAAALGASGYTGLLTPMTKFTSQASGALTGGSAGTVTGGGATNTGGISTLQTNDKKTNPFVGTALENLNIKPESLAGGYTSDKYSRPEVLTYMQGLARQGKSLADIKAATAKQFSLAPTQVDNFLQVRYGDQMVPGTNMTVQDAFALLEKRHPEIGLYRADNPTLKREIGFFTDAAKSSAWGDPRVAEYELRQAATRDRADQGTMDPAQIAWLLKEPDLSKIKDNMERKVALETWQKSNPRYSDPAKFSTFEEYVGDIVAKNPGVGFKPGTPEWSSLKGSYIGAHGGSVYNYSPGQPPIILSGNTEVNTMIRNGMVQAKEDGLPYWGIENGRWVHNGGDPSLIGKYVQDVLPSNEFGSLYKAGGKPSTTPMPSATTARPSGITSRPAGISAITPARTQALMTALARAAAARRTTPTTASRTTAKQAGIGSLTPTTVLRRKPVGGAAGGDVTMLAKGRYLKGNGDGVSDSIPAKFAGSGQPAALADGEFVIPARVVSELGNGSSDAGARKLYAMLDRVEQRARKAKRGKPSGADRELKKLA